MIDFSALKGLTIPEGNVKQISDAQGNVLWSAVKMAKVTIIQSGTPKETSFGKTYYASASIDGLTYRTHTTISVPIGTVIHCIADNDSQDSKCYIYLNGNVVEKSESGQDANYNYMVIGDTCIELVTKSKTSGVTMYYGNISITET